MRTHRAIALLTMVSFLPLAAGCSAETTVVLGTDPDTRAEVVSFDEPVAISGYTTRHGGFRHWRGTVQNYSADGLLFIDQSYTIETRDDQRTKFRLARDDVVSVRILEPQGGQTTLLILGVAIGLILVAIVVAGYKSVQASGSR